MSTYGTILAQSTWDTIDKAEARGAHRQHILEESGFDPNLYSEPDQQVPIDLHCAVWAAAMRQVRDPGFPIYVAERKSLGDFQSMGFLGASSASVLKALESVVRFMPIYHSDSRWRLESNAEGWAVLKDCAELTSLGQRCGIETGFACLMQGLRLILGQRLVPLEVSFSHAMPSSISQHARFFGVRPQFSAPDAKMVFSFADCERSIPSHNPQLHRILTQHAEFLMERVPKVATFRGQVEQTVRELLQAAESTPTADRVARRLGASARTLRRRLEEEGTTFITTVAEVRRGLAERYLSEDRLPVDEVAIRLGFSDTSAFRRAFKRWTGQSPGHFLDQRSRVAGS